jgi:hypothetical protein
MVIYSHLLLLFYMVRAKLIARKHIRAPPRKNAMPTESHSDGQRANYFSRTLVTPKKKKEALELTKNLTF